MKRLVALLLVLVMVMSVMAGCRSPQTAEETPAEKKIETQVPVTAPEAPAQWDESQATETMVIHISSQAHSLSKWATTAGDMMTDLCYLVFDPVLWMEEDGTVSPWLAEEYKMADDGMSIDFKFREDVYFTNGAHLTAEDVSFTF